MKGPTGDDFGFRQGKTAETTETESKELPVAFGNSGTPVSQIKKLNLFNFSSLKRIRHLTDGLSLTT